MWLLSASDPLQGFDASSRLGDHAAIEGWAAVYVDDIMIAADRDLAHAVAAAIQECWECTTPQEVGTDHGSPVRFLGMDLCWDQQGNLVTC